MPDAATQRNSAKPAGKRRFPGFPPGRLSFTPIPDLFFSELLPALDDPAQVKVILHVLWLLHRRRRRPRWVSLAELAEDALLLHSLASVSDDPLQRLEEALGAAVAGGALLSARSRESGGTWFMINGASGRETLAALQRGEIRLPDGSAVEEERTLPLKLTIFSLYEQNIGPLQPIIAEELEQAQKTYPEEWVEEAFRIAAENNARSWRYVSAILDRWQRQGRSDVGQRGSERGRRYVTGEFEQYRQL